MKIKIWLLSSLKYLASRPRTYEILLATSLAAFSMTALSLAYAIHQPQPAAVYYNFDDNGQITPATTIQANDWLSTSEKSVLGEQVER